MARTIMSLFLILDGGDGIRMTFASVDTLINFPPWSKERSLLISTLVDFSGEILCLECSALSMRVLLKPSSMNHGGC